MLISRASSLPEAMVSEIGPLSQYVDVSAIIQATAVPAPSSRIVNMIQLPEPGADVVLTVRFRAVQEEFESRVVTSDSVSVTEEAPDASA